MTGDARANRSRVTVAAAGSGRALIGLLGALGAATGSAQIVLHEASNPDIEWQRDLASSAAELQFSADGKRVILWHNDGRRSAVATFDAANGALVREQTLGADRITRAIAVSSTGRLAAAAQDFIDVFDLASGEPVFRRFACEKCDIAVLAFSPNGSKLAMQDSRAPRERALGIGVARILDLATRQVVEIEAIAGSRNAVSFSKDGGRLLTAHVEYLGREEWLGFRVWDTDGPTLKYTASFPRSTMGAIATGAIEGAGFVAVSGNEGYIEMRDLTEETVLWSVPMIPNPFAGADGLRFGVELEHVAIAGDGSFVVGYERPAGSGGSMTVRRILVRDSGGIVVRRTRDGSIVAVYDVPGVTTLSAAPDGKSFAFTSSKLLPRLALVSAPQ